MLNPFNRTLQAVFLAVQGKSRIFALCFRESTGFFPAPSFGGQGANLRSEAKMDILSYTYYRC